MECPSTKEREAATLYLTDLNGMKKNGEENSDLLRFYAKVKTSRSKTRSAYTLMDHRVAVDEDRVRPSTAAQKTGSTTPCQHYRLR